MKTKLSYAWVRNTTLFRSVSTGLTFDEKHKLAVDLMVADVHQTENVVFECDDLFWAITDFDKTPQGYTYWIKWVNRIDAC